MLSRWFEQQWQVLGWAQLFLQPCAWLFRLLSAFRRLAYRYGLLKRWRLPVPVIVVGNISVGGVGKTPVVLALAQALRAQGYQPGILSRGYGGQATGLVSVHSNPLQYGDEPVLLAQRSGCPVWVSPDRVAAGHALLAAHMACDVLICDDGLQHYRLQRDIEIAVVQRPYGLGNGQLLPAGPLRESVRRLQQVDVVIESGALPKALPQQPCYQLTLQAGSWTSVTDPNQHISNQMLQTQPLVAIAGIGHPQRFFAMLHDMGLSCQTQVFADHHAYTQADFAALADKTILMTEKDAVKCRGLQLRNAWYLPVQAELQPCQHSQSLQQTVQDLLHLKTRQKEIK